MRIMGLDVGTKRIGVAVSDPTGMIAQGKGYVERASDEITAGKIKEFLKEYGVEKIVVGHPINMDGTSGERARDTENFASMIEKNTGIPVVLWDERLSTKEAVDIMVKADISRAKRKKSVDSLAAQIILQNYLDSQSRE